MTLRDRARRLLPKRRPSWPDLVREEFAWTEALGMSLVQVNHFLWGSSVRFEGGGFGIVLSEEVEGGLGLNGYVYRRGDHDDAKNTRWVLARYRPDGPRFDLDPRAPEALATATHELSVALSEVMPEIVRIESEGGSAW